MKPTHILLGAIAILLLSLSHVFAAAKFRPGTLRCEQQLEPLSVDVSAPRLDWTLVPIDAGARNLRQTAYQVVAASSEDKLTPGTADFWNSGKVVSDQNTLVAYGGAPLRSRQTVFWKVRVWDQDDAVSDWSAPARFGMGLMEPGDWRARWLSIAQPANPLRESVWIWAGKPDSQMMYPPGARYFRKQFTLPEDSSISGARALMTADNSFALFINGTEALKGSSHQLTFEADIAVLLRRGLNVLAVAATNGGSAPNQAGLLGLIEFRFADGDALAVPVDDSWRASEQAAAGWRSAEFDDSAWAPAHVLGTNGMAPWGEVSTFSPPLSIFRREFDVARPIRRATVFACGLGQHEIRLNGRKVGNDVMEPGWTNYRETCFYTAHDVTDQLKTGRNALGVMLGNGMYNVTGGRYVKFRGSFGSPSLILQLEIEHTDGTFTTIATDESWKTASGPITFSCIFGGEDYDARREVPGWDRARFDDRAWELARAGKGPGGALRAQMSPPIRVQREFASVQVTQPRPGVFVYDLGQNFSGWPKLSVRAPAGAQVNLIPGELLDANGLVTQRSSGGPVRFSYTCRCDGVETWSPRFSYYGFRYVQVEGAAPESELDTAPHVPRIVRLTGEFLYSSAPVAGEFECSNELVNRIHQLILAAIRCNLQSVLTDCPHREKLGWLEVSHLLAGGIMFNHDTARFYAKVSRDMREAQLPDGLVPDIAPEYTVFQGGFRDSPEWGSASVFNPWHVYQFYGDHRLLETNYDVMERYVEYLGTRATNHIVSHGLGDWYDIGPNRPGASQLTSIGLTATAIYFGTLEVLADTARRMGRSEDAARFAKLAGEVRSAFNATFFQAESNQYDRGSQTAQAMPLVLGMVEDERRAAVLEQLVRAVETNQFRVTAGDVGFTYVVKALMEAGRDDVIYAMVCQTNGPGYADQLRKGATTLTEAWDADPRSSQNHCMLGHAEEWFYAGLAGIRPDPAGPGFKRMILKPAVVGGLTWVRAHYDSPQGRIESVWAKARGENVLSWRVVVPPNSTATIFVPLKKGGFIRESGFSLQARGLRQLRAEEGFVVFEIGSGAYEFASELPTP